MATTNTTEQVTSRAFGRCRTKGCKWRIVHTVVVPSSMDPVARRYQAMVELCAYGAPRCPEHRMALEVTTVRATLRPETPCTTGCTNSTTPTCKCSCGGSHHGEDVPPNDLWATR